jgi:hypothetical protein
VSAVRQKKGLYTNKPVTIYRQSELYESKLSGAILAPATEIRTSKPGRIDGKKWMYVKLELLFYGI